METLKIEKKNTKMIAHRGLSGLEKENTCLAFVAAGNRSFYGIETDVHLTKDNVFVICHDFNTGRVSNENLEIKDTTFDELRNICLYDFNSQELKPYIKIPTLKEYLLICKKYNKHCVIEVKPEFTLSQIQKLLDEVNQINELKDTTFISFSLENLKKIRNINSSIPLQYLTSVYTNELPAICAREKVDIDILYSQLTKENMKAFKEHNIAINAWTVNNSVDAQKLIDLEIDFITTNILE